MKRRETRKRREMRRNKTLGERGSKVSNEHQWDMNVKRWRGRGGRGAQCIMGSPPVV